MKQNTAVLSLDLGTQGTKAALVRLDGSLIDSAFSRNRFYDGPGGAILLDADALLDGVAEATATLLARNPDAEILGVGTVGMMAGIVGIDKNWTPVTHYDSGLDKRCETAVARMQAIGNDETVAICGSPIIVAQGAKLCWWMTEQPEAFARAAKFVPASTFVCGAMAGLRADEAYIDVTHIHLTCLADTAHGVWSERLLRLFGFPREKLPEIVSPCQIIGHVTPAWSARTGLRAGTAIIAGCGDTAASALGAGLVRDGTILDVAGTASCLLACTSEYRPDVERKILIQQRSVLPGLWNPFGFVLGGQTLSWYLEQVRPDGGFAALAAKTRSVTTDGLYFVPFFAGRVCPSDARFSGSWLGLKFYHAPEHLFKSIMESIAYEYRFYLERLCALYPAFRVRQILTSAGGSRSPEFNQIKADVLAAPVTPILQTDSTHVAAALMTGHALGVYGDLAAAAECLTRASCAAPVPPDPASSTAYRARYDAYQNIIALLEQFHI